MSYQYESEMLRRVWWSNFGDIQLGGKQLDIERTSTAAHGQKFREQRALQIDRGTQRSTHKLANTEKDNGDD